MTGRWCIAPKQMRRCKGGTDVCRCVPPLPSSAHHRRGITWPSRSTERRAKSIGRGLVGIIPRGCRQLAFTFAQGSGRLVSLRHSRARSAGEFVVCRPICVTRGHVRDINLLIIALRTIEIERSSHAAARCCPAPSRVDCPVRSGLHRELVRSAWRPHRYVLDGAALN